jgi:hypothetical protein
MVKDDADVILWLKVADFLPFGASTTDSSCLPLLLALFREIQ